MSLYGEYIYERENKFILETTEGFLTYSFEGENCYLQDVFVSKQHRNKKVCFEMCDRVTEIAKNHGCKFLLGSVVPSVPGATESMKMMLAYGSKIDSCANNFILLKKEI